LRLDADLHIFPAHGLSFLVNNFLDAIVFLLDIYAAAWAQALIAFTTTFRTALIVFPCCKIVIAGNMDLNAEFNAC
jgi:hypothetical protein